MACISKDSIAAAAHAVGVELSNEIVEELAPEVEYRMREIIQDATKFMRHSKRVKLTCDDVNAALKLRNCDSTFGYTVSEEPFVFKHIVNSNVYFIQDKELTLSSIINSQLPPVPVDTTVMAHWLAIEGVQPKISNNPPDLEATSTPMITSNSNQAGFSKKKKNAMDSLDKDVKPVVRHVLSKELQIYYEKVTEILVGGRELLIREAVKSVGQDAGLQPLTPYLTQFIAEETTRNLKDLFRLKSLLRLTASLLSNEHLHIEPYLHQLMPPILTCVVGRKLGSSPKDHDPSHWYVRKLAARVVLLVCRNFGQAYYNIQPRITRTLLRAFLDPGKPLTTHFGAITALKALGSRVVRLLLLPNLSSYMVFLLKELDKANNHLADSIKARQERERKEEEEKANEDPDNAMAVDQETEAGGKDKAADKKSKKKEKEKKEEPSQGNPATVSGARLFEITQCFGALLEVRSILSPRKWRGGGAENQKVNVMLKARNESVEQASGECLRDALKADLATRFVQSAVESPEFIGKQGQVVEDKNASNGKADNESVDETGEVLKSRPQFRQYRINVQPLEIFKLLPETHATGSQRPVGRRLERGYKLGSTLLHLV